MHRRLFILGVTCALTGVTIGSLFQSFSGPIDLVADEPTATRTEVDPSTSAEFTRKSW